MEEKLRILKMVEDGIITAAEAQELLKALEEPAGDPFAQPQTDWQEPIRENIPYEDRMFRVICDSADGDKVRVQFPIKAIRAILKITGQLPVNVTGMEGVNIEELTDVVIQCLDSETIGDIVTVDSADGDHIRLFIG